MTEELPEKPSKWGTVSKYMAGFGLAGGALGAAVGGVISFGLAKGLLGSAAGWAATAGAYFLGYAPALATTVAAPLIGLAVIGLVAGLVFGYFQGEKAHKNNEADYRRDVTMLQRRNHQLQASLQQKRMQVAQQGHALFGEAAGPSSGLPASLSGGMAQPSGGSGKGWFG